jgi:hypothetical protein
MHGLAAGRGEKVEQRRMGLFMGLFNLSVVVPQLASTRIGFVLRDAADKSVLFVICGSCLAVSAALWMLVSDNKKAGAPATNPEKVRVIPGAH